MEGIAAHPVEPAAETGRIPGEPVARGLLCTSVSASVNWICLCFLFHSAVERGQCTMHVKMLY